MDMCFGIAKDWFLGLYSDALVRAGMAFSPPGRYVLMFSGGHSYQYSLTDLSALGLLDESLRCTTMGDV